jgi:hypothetical protein
MAGKSQVLPAEAWIRSSVTERRLQELVHNGQRSPVTEPNFLYLIVLSKLNMHVLLARIWRGLIVSNGESSIYSVNSE